MDNVLTLIAPSNGLDDNMTARVRSALADLGADVGPVRALAANTAADIPFSLLAPGQADAAARAVLADAPVDIVAQPAAFRRKTLLLADMDSTMVVGETLDELADFAGLKAHIAAITARAMNGEIDFKTAIRERVGLLAGLPADSLEKTCQRIVYTPGARALIATMRAAGAYTVLVSGGFSYFTGAVRAYCGFDEDLSNHLEMIDGKLSGRVLDPILDRNAKLRTLLDRAARRGIAMPLTMAVGDGANDLEMIKAAGLGVAFHAKPVVAAEARAKIHHCDLSALLYIQGYSENEIAKV